MPTFCTQKKGYFVNSMKKPTTIAYRANFISCYFEYMRRTHRWVQPPISQALYSKKRESVKNTGFSFVD
jgi:hypothetical protein